MYVCVQLNEVNQTDNHFTLAHREDNLMNGSTILTPKRMCKHCKQILYEKIVDPGRGLAVNFRKKCGEMR